MGVSWGWGKSHITWRDAYPDGGWGKNNNINRDMTSTSCARVLNFCWWAEVEVEAEAAAVDSTQRGEGGGGNGVAEAAHTAVSPCHSGGFFLPRCLPNHKELQVFAQAASQDAGVAYSRGSP